MSYTDFSEEKDQEVIDYCRQLKVNDKIKFQSEKQRYTIKAKSDNFLICTKPFNPKKTVLYTIIDLDRYVRGRNNMIFNPYDYAVQDDIIACLRDLEADGNLVEVSHRNCIKLDVEIK